jgi:hypothetical protein
MDEKKKKLNASYISIIIIIWIDGSRIDTIVIDYVLKSLKRKNLTFLNPKEKKNKLIP